MSEASAPLSVSARSFGAMAPRAVDAQGLAALDPTSWPVDVARRPFKRILDAAAAAVLLVFTAPLLLVLAVMVKADGGPALFRQERIGRGGRPFDCLKLRTMRRGAEESLARYLLGDPDAAAEWQLRQKLGRDPRVTRIGRFLRLSGLDELPQLLNVLRGEMSLVGPRPVPAAELAGRYGCRAPAYAACTPGITGLWQVKGRSWTTYRRRVAIDSYYARNRSFRLDLLILFRTTYVVLAAHGSEGRRPPQGATEEEEPQSIRGD